MTPYPWDVPGRVQGVDVSSCQSQPLPWPAIAAAGCRFAIVKATEGHSGVDPMFSAHVEGARAAGLKVGSYGYLHSSESGILQAERHFARIEKTALDMRPMLDWEDAERVDAMGPGGIAAALDCALAFLERLHALCGRRPVLYTYPGFLYKFHTASKLAMLLDYDLVISHFRWDPNTGRDYELRAPTIPAPYTTASGWQCGGNRCPRIPGVGVDLDRDVFFGDEAAFDAWNLDAPAHEPAPEHPVTPATLLASELDDPDPHREDT